MKEQNPHVCRAMSISRKDSTGQSKNTLSSFINITIPQPKIRIKMPKLLAKTLRGRNPQKCNDTGNANDTKKKNRSTKTGNAFSLRVGSIVSNVFGNKKSAEKRGRKDDQKYKEETKEMKKEVKVPLSFPQNFNGRNKKQVGTSSNLMRVSNKKVRRGRSMRKKEINNQEDENKDEDGWEKEEEEEKGEEELCKKRILMGQKCRPLNQSDVLHYDENGVLLPEERESM